MEERGRDRARGGAKKDERNTSGRISGHIDDQLNYTVGSSVTWCKETTFWHRFSATTVTKYIALRS